MLKRVLVKILSRVLSGTALFLTFTKGVKSWDWKEPGENRQKVASSILFYARSKICIRWVSQVDPNYFEHPDCLPLFKTM
jgi:hypothetical protein